MPSPAGLRLDIRRTPNGLLVTCGQLGPDFPPRCIRGMHDLGRVLDQAWATLDAQHAAQSAQRYTGRYAPGRGSHNPADWRRLKAGERKILSKAGQKPVDCPDGAWQSPGGNVYWPDSPQVPQAARRLADAGEFPPLQQAAG